MFTSFRVFPEAAALPCLDIEEERIRRRSVGPMSECLARWARRGVPSGAAVGVASVGMELSGRDGAEDSSASWREETMSPKLMS